MIRHVNSNSVTRITRFRTLELIRGSVVFPTAVIISPIFQLDHKI